MKLQTNSILLTIVGIVAIIISLLFTEKQENCWDKYQTENDAIMHCEEH
jgi:uncharacterized phage infection (PIP) family protein YhgE